MGLEAVPDLNRDWEGTLGLFREAAFHGAASSAASWKKVWERLPPESPFLQHWPGVWEDIRSAADPDLALGCLLRWIEQDLSAESGALEGPRARRWGSSERFRRGFLALAGVSPALGEYLLSLWESFDPEAWQTGWATSESLAARLAATVGSAGEREFLQRTRRFRLVETLRIAYLDCVEKVPVDQVTRQISALADVLVASCLDRATLETAKRSGYAPPSRGFSVLALGKLGGDELNYSSDIDLNFVYDERVEGLERESGGATVDPLEIETFFTRLAERLVSYITKFTSQGRLYRLDTRLRPEGGSGRLVWSARASVNYYYSVGRNWERQALIRMRHVAGDADLSHRLREDLRSYIFPATLSEKYLSEMRELKFQVEKIAADRGQEKTEIKIGQGGIRDVEYIVQFLQLVHGSRIPSLQVANIFEALEVLERKSILKAEETDILRRGYRFLRRVEHRLQLAHMLQTHRLPEEPRELLRLAKGLGFRTEALFRGTLARHSAEIRRVYRLLFEQATRETSVSDLLPALLDLPLESVRDEGAQLLVPYGFKDPARAFQRLRELAGGERTLVDSGQAKEVFRRLMFKLLREVSRHPEPDRTLSNFEDCVRSLGGRSVFYQLLDESEPTLQLFVDLAARSNLLVEIFRRRPDIFDEVVDCLLTGYRFDRKMLVEKVEELWKRSREFEREIFNFKYTHLLLTAIRELQGDEKLRVTLQHVSEIAEALLQGILLQSLAEAERKLGRWVGRQPKWVVLGLGKLGGQEMTFQSDIDIVFLYEGEETTDRGLGSREFFERFSQIVLNACKAADFLGPLLRVDVRLRPLGSHNSLMISMDGWKRYFSEGPGETWERLAFMRARPVAGSMGLGDRAMRFIRSFLVLGGSAGPPDAQTVRDDVWKMRRKLEAHAAKGDLKRGRGGIMDVEFLVQTLQVLHGKEFPEILVPNTARAIEEIRRAGLISPTQASELFSSYRFLRWVECRFSLVREPGESLEQLDESELLLTIQKIGYRSTGEESAVDIFSAELEYHRWKNRQALLGVLEKEEGPASVGP